jgi:murein DD-endopeptidase MepM/ murein hydrolase activator NlpD
MYLSRCEPTNNKDVEMSDTNELVIEEIETFVQGYSEKLYSIDSGIVQPNQSLGQILPNYGVNYSTIVTLSDSFKDVFDVKKIYPNDKYYIVKSNDSLATPIDFLYEKSARELVVMHLNDSVSIDIVKKPITIELKEAGGVIKSSLWNSFMSNDLTPALVNRVANLYAWTIDFFGIQENDFYKIIYEAQYVDGQFIGVGKIKAILFNHMGKEFYAFDYDSPIEEGFHYYNENGESMKKALLSAPLEYVRISSKFSNSRLHPITKKYTPHHGVDYAAPTGTPVVSTGDGKVFFIGKAGGAGKMIKIKHTFGDVITKYLHLSKYASGIKKGSFVKQGQKIAEVGNTGMSTGPHLDYRIYINGKAVDPLKMTVPSKDPIPDSLKDNYVKDIATIKNSLDQIAL